jgi:sugar phosphate isomerase/epimerase
LISGRAWWGEGTLEELAAIATGEGIAYAINGDSVLNPATPLPEQQGANDEMLKRMLDMAGHIGCGYYACTQER